MSNSEERTLTMNDTTTTSRCALAAGSRRPWTAEDVAELKERYEGHGEKACLPIRIIAQRLGRSEAAVWSKLQRVYANVVVRDGPSAGRSL